MPGSAVQVEFAKLKNLSAMSADELVVAFRITFCFRRLVIEKYRPSFLELVQEVPAYITVPQVVCFHKFV
jgi:hypothetical protein